MRDAEKTVGNMIDKLKTAFIGSIDSEGFPNMKAMLQPRKRQGKSACGQIEHRAGQYPGGTGHE